MRTQNAPAIPTTTDTPQARRSDRERKATARFAEGWFGLQLPRLSSALGVGTAGKGPESNRATKTTTDTKTIENEASPSCDDEPRALFFEACDEVQILGVMIEEKEGDHDGGRASEPRRSGRERKATRRFEEGWFGGRLPNLSAALGVVVSEGKGR